jgi:hypothetical protein
MRRFGVCCVVLLGGVSCAEPLPSVAPAPGCEAACDGATSCVLSADPECRFREPGPWFVVESMIDSDIAPLGVRGELYAFPSALGHVVTPIAIGKDSLDDEFWVSWGSEWSPDGEILLYDSCNGYEDVSLVCRLFTIEFGKGLPSEPRLVENLPHGAPVFAGDWSHDSSAFTASSNEEIYVVRREGSELVPSLLSTAPEVGWVNLCPGGEFAVHDDRSGTVTLLRTDGDSAGHVELGAPSAIYSSSGLSPDGRWVVLSSDEEDGENLRYSLSLYPCGEGEPVRLFETTEGELDGWFSPDSRYLTIDVWSGETVGYVDMHDESLTLIPFPEDVVWTSSWSASVSYLVVGTSDASAYAFRPDTRELVPIGEPGTVRASSDEYEIWALGEIVEYYVRDPDTSDVTRVELYDPLASIEPIARFEPDPGTFDMLIIDDASTRVAYTLAHSGGSSLTIVDLGRPDEPSTLFMPGAYGLWLETFSHDGKTVVLTLSQPEFGLYWVSVPEAGEPPELRVMVPSQGGAFVGEQPWP